MVSNLSTHISAVIKKYANGNRPANITMADLYVAIEVPGKSTLIQDRSLFGRASDASDQHGAHKPIQTFLMHECADVDPMYRVAGDAYSGCLIKAVREDPVESFVKYPEPFCPAPGDTYPPVVTLTSEELCQLIAASRDKASVHILQCTDYYASSGEAWHGDLQVVVSVLESSQIDPFTHLTCTREKKTDDLLALFVDTCGASIGQAVDDEEFEFDLETDLEKILSEAGVLDELQTTPDDLGKHFLAECRRQEGWHFPLSFSWSGAFHLARGGPLVDPTWNRGGAGC